MTIKLKLHLINLKPRPELSVPRCRGAPAPAGGVGGCGGFNLMAITSRAWLSHRPAGSPPQTVTGPAVGVAASNMVGVAG